MKAERKLAAIMFTDMVGYTALAQRDEHLSLELVEEQRRIIRSLLANHNGREIKTIGDAFLVEFPNAVDAVRCAYDIQRKIREFNFSLSEENRIRLRIGIHLGEVVESQGDISGDAVNVASRIEHFAEGGGICLTRQVYDHINNKIDLPLTNLGPKSLKNVGNPVEVFMVVMPWETETLGLSGHLDAKRLAVMPFVNMSTDPGDAYFADGLTEELISTISNIRELTVISRTSVMKYKGGSATAGEIGGALKVGSIVEGSVRKSANRARISAQLIDVNTDGHLWAKTYDRNMDDIFAIQSEIAQQVAEALKVQLLANERKEVEKRPTESTRAYMMYLKGRYYWNERTKDSLDTAMTYFKRAIELDPRFALGYSGLADCYTISADWYWMNPVDAFPMAREYDLKALEIDPKLAEAHASLGLIYNSYDGNWSEAEHELLRAIELKPGLAYVHMWYGILLDAIGRFDEAIEQLKLALELDPLSRLVRANLGFSFVLMGRANEAIAQFEQALKEDPSFSNNYEGLGWALYLNSRPQEAVEKIRHATILSNNSPWMKSSLACVLALTGKPDEALKLLRELKETATSGVISKVHLAQILFTLGENEEAFVYLEKAIEDKSIFTNHATDLAALRSLPWFIGARSDKRWAALEVRLGLQTR